MKILKLVTVICLSWIFKDSSYVSCMTGEEALHDSRHQRPPAVLVEQPAVLLEQPIASTTDIIQRNALNGNNNNNNAEINVNSDILSNPESQPGYDSFGTMAIGRLYSWKTNDNINANLASEITRDNTIERIQRLHSAHGDFSYINNFVLPESPTPEQGRELAKNCIGTSLSAIDTVYVPNFNAEHIQFLRFSEKVLIRLSQPDMPACFHSSEIPVIRDALSKIHHTIGLYDAYIEGPHRVFSEISATPSEVAETLEQELPNVPFAPTPNIIVKVNEFPETVTLAEKRAFYIKQLRMNSNILSAINPVMQGNETNEEFNANTLRQHLNYLIACKVKLEESLRDTAESLQQADNLLVTREVPLTNLAEREVLLEESRVIMQRAKSDIKTSWDKFVGDKNKYYKIATIASVVILGGIVCKVTKFNPFKFAWKCLSYIPNALLSMGTPGTPKPKPPLSILDSMTTPITSLGKNLSPGQQNGLSAIIGAGATSGIAGFGYLIRKVIIRK